MERICPDCAKPLLGQDRDGVHVDGCASCALLWLDGGELEALGESLFPVPRPFRIHWVAASGSSPERCPGCGETTLWLGSIDQHPVRRCASCGGHLVRTAGSFAAPDPDAHDLWIAGDFLVSLLEFLDWS